jgi:type I restriction enzyme S subunit
MTVVVEESLGSVANIIMGLSPKGDTYNNEGIGTPLLNGPTEFGDTNPDCSLFTTDSKRECKKGDLIFCVRASTGKMNWADRVYSLGRGVCSISGETQLDTKFIRYYLDFKLDALLKNAGGGTFSNLRKDALRDFKIPYPPYRSKIASILSAYDDLIEKDLKRIKILEEMVQMIYKEWFVNFRFPGHEKVKMVKSELGMVPEGWEIKNLGDVCDVVMGQSPKSEFYNTSGEGLPFHQGVTHFGKRFPKHNMYCTVENRIAEKGDLLLSVRAPVGRINIANSKLIIGRGLSSIRHKEGLQSFLYYQLKEIFSEEDIMGSGSIFKAITKEDLFSLKVLLPSKALDEDFNTLAAPIDSEIEILSVKNENLRKTCDLLLPKLINGEIDVEKLISKNS